MKNALTEAPGPGAYSPMEKRFNETHGFSKSISKDQMSMTVGPGTYKLKPYFGQCDGLNQDPKDILYVWPLLFNVSLSSVIPIMANYL